MKLWLPARRDVVTFAGVFGLLGAVYLLPPDTALHQVQAAGTLRVCLPPSYPPLVTGDPAFPGLDVELLQAIAARLHVNLAIVTNSTIGKDFNPRAWRITRAQCEVIAGGVADSKTTRSFLDTTSAYATTGWAWLSNRPPAEFSRMRTGVLVGASGLDRVALAAWLRAAKTQIVIVPDAAALVQGVRDGRFDVGVTEHLLAVELAAKNGLAVGWMPGELARYRLVFGLWKGDLTLKRAIVAVMERLRGDGEQARIQARYLPSVSSSEQEPGE
jgi:ABC-type amino acid transport substrate-binding protein